MARTVVVLALCGWVAGNAPAAWAISITGFSSEANDRFSSGYPSAPVANSSPNFVGAGFDLNGVAWDAGNPAGSWGFLTPKHLVMAKHYVGSTAVNYVDAAGNVQSATRASVTNTGVGIVIWSTPDIAVGTLTQAVPTSHGLPRYAILDLNASSTSINLYNGLPVFLYGFGASGPRVGVATVSNTFTDPAISTTQANVQFQVGDSGSPVLYGWTNPVGGKEMTILGVNSGVGTINGAASNFMSFLGNPNAIAAVNAITTADGYAMRIVGELSAVWTGSTSSSLWVGGNWNGNPVDTFAAFESGGSTPTTIDVNAAATIRGLYFGATEGATDGFTFSGANTLTIGRGGLTNYTGLRQTFSAPLSLGDHQYWDVGSGGVTAAAINTNGKLLEVAGSGTARITGAVSGGGGLALSGHRLELTGSSSYTGGTWVHAGTLVANGNIAASSGVSVDAGAELGGSGHVAAISGAGLVGPGNSPGILTAPSVDASGGLDFAFELTQKGAPNWGTPTASGNDVLRLMDATAPFTTALGSENVINVFFGTSSLAKNDTFLGGFFTDRSGDFWSRVQHATYAYYVLGNGHGTAKTYNNQGYYLLDMAEWRVDVSTVSVASALFADGTVTDGQVMQFVAVPEPSAVVLVAVAIGVVIAGWGRRGKTS